MTNRLLACAAALVLVAGCTDKPADDAETEATGAAETAYVATPEEHIGSWETTYPDGSVGVTTIREDGTFTRKMASGEEGSGTWSIVEGKTCFDPEGDDPEHPTRCYVVGKADENSNRTLTMDDGTVLTTHKVEAEASAT